MIVIFYNVPSKTSVCWFQLLHREDLRLFVKDMIVNLASCFQSRALIVIIWFLVQTHFSPSQKSIADQCPALIGRYYNTPEAQRRAESASLSVRDCWAFWCHRSDPVNTWWMASIEPTQWHICSHPPVFPPRVQTRALRRRHVVFEADEFTVTNRGVNFQHSFARLHSACQQQQLSITVERIQISVSVYAFCRDMKRLRRVAAPSHTQSDTHRRCLAEQDL